MDPVCWYVNHWFLSFVIILMIISQVGIELSFKGFVITMIAQYVMVQIAWNNHGQKCLNDEKVKLERRMDRLTRG
jgi:hypothetical protein